MKKIKYLFVFLTLSLAIFILTSCDIDGLHPQTCFFFDDYEEYKSVIENGGFQKNESEQELCDIFYSTNLLDLDNNITDVLYLGTTIQNGTKKLYDDILYWPRIMYKVENQKRLIGIVISSYDKRGKADIVPADDPGDEFIKENLKYSNGYSTSFQHVVSSINDTQLYIDSLKKINEEYKPKQWYIDYINNYKFDEMKNSNLYIAISEFKLSYYYNEKENFVASIQFIYVIEKEGVELGYDSNFLTEEESKYQEKVLEYAINNVVIDREKKQIC